VDFFAEFDSWLDALLGTYIGATAHTVALALEPAVLVLATLYVMGWGYLQLTGRIDEPLMTGVKRIVTLAVLLGVGLDLWLYDALIVDTFLRAPSELASAVIGSSDPVTIIDQILLTGGDAASALLEKAGLLSGWVYGLVGVIVYAMVGLVAVYTMFLLALSRVALSVLLALGPLFIGTLLFESTRRLFESWIAQLVNYALVTILTVLVAALLLALVTAAAEQAASEGPAITIAEAVRLCLACGLILLVLRQVLPIAAGLSHGVALSSFHVASRAVSCGLGGAGRVARGGARALGRVVGRRASALPASAERSEAA
jgi:type IV secretion system protein VirB6